MSAHQWANWLAEIPPRQRILVFSDPLPDPALPQQLAQVLDQHQFANTYAIERGGFVSNTFFNGPLLPADERAIPPYWWDGFRPGHYVETYCERLKPFYDYVVVWNPRTTSLMSAMQSCFGEPLNYQSGFGLWVVEP
jgi:hypothetical protein